MIGEKVGAMHFNKNNSSRLHNSLGTWAIKVRRHLSTRDIIATADDSEYDFLGTTPFCFAPGYRRLFTRQSAIEQRYESQKAKTALLLLVF